MAEALELPQKFRAAGHSCGIKGDSSLDLSLFVSDVPSVAAGVFTQNRVCGAPVKVSRGRVPAETVRAVVINSGNANACTGDRGTQDAERMTVSVAECLNCEPRDVLVCSTGVIGHFLPMDRLNAGIPNAVDKLDSSPDAFRDAAGGIMTTDTVHKQSVREVDIDGKMARVSAAAKGAAMIGPNMATMLAVVMTDVELSVEQADSILRRAVDSSFNCIGVEGHTSTSDTVLLLANGAARTGRLDASGLTSIKSAVQEVCIELAQAIIRDAEGADHFITIDITGARTRDEALLIAKTIANDALVKTAIAGADPNWGRIVSTCGRTGIELTENDITLSINGTTIYRSGTPVAYDDASVSKQIRENRDVDIRLNLPFGDAAVRFWTSDLTQEYVRLNSEYTT